MRYKDIYSPPFSCLVPYILDQHYLTVLHPICWHEEQRSVAKKVCAILNGENEDLHHVSVSNKVDFNIDGVSFVLSCKSYLSSPNYGLRLPKEEAISIQNELSDWIFDTLKKQVVSKRRTCCILRLYKWIKKD